LKTGKSRNVNWSDAPTAAIATPPRCPMNAMTTVWPLARMSCSMMPGHASWKRPVRG
jgi:hypothetical protein